ncbi:MAG: ubiquinol-cytochrome c reductase iron-sulfur subunit [Actinomycetota bacterium]|jgi:ubiquinol-cytochrome c reductase iron-sulfur subunit|nr:ubiquinol-cytochrome c reductase iron-sulfur subunit [Glaciihabitans sp.]MDQ1561935.1 ubiquinol-cytochrome c reductase iron-sulfur subunit [Actinomycetota bacterium]MDQ1564956.1 ubiquinol-cytochrome c reductase iron-sulfur subunit [Actinomycetota bacterium]
MAQHGDSNTASGTAVKVSRAPESPGTGVVQSDIPQNPGFPPHNPRMTDLDPNKEKRAERQVAILFFLSIIGSIFALAAYIAYPIIPGDFGSIRTNNLLLGLGITLGLLGIGLGAVHWAKQLMREDESVELRHGTRGTPETREKAVEVFELGNAESGFGRRTLIRNSMIGALVLTPVPAIALFRDLAPMADPVKLLQHTMWKKGTRLTHDPTGIPIKASDVTLGSAFHVIPEGLLQRTDMLEQKAKAAVLLMRLLPQDLHVTKGRETWNYNGIIAYSKICTHVGCPVALYEQDTHHLLCPCHQSQFDITHEAKVIFGPARRPLPQLPITVDSEGYLVAQSDFHEPVGPDFWERET